MASKITRIYTGLAGLPASKDPIRELLRVYSRVSRALERLPKESKYRITTENLIEKRRQIIVSTSDPLEVEKKIGDGICEEMIEHAKLELNLIGVMEKYQPWEPLEEKPPADQWKWPL